MTKDYKKVTNFKTVGWAYLPNKEKQAAFTLAEVLITLAIIGIVAVFTIPTLIQNINNRQYITATNNFNRRFGEALKVMNSQGVLAYQGITENFVKELSQYYKILQVCDNTKLDECFETTVVWGEAGDVDLSKVSTAKDISIYDWGTNVLGVRFINGVSGLIAYNPKCKQEQFNNNLITISGDKNNVGFSTNNCLAMLYDINSNKKPNRLNQDVQTTSNIRSLKQGVIATINGVKITKVVLAGKYDPIDCTDVNGDDYEFCYGSSTYANDYWAGAAKICEGQENMPSKEDLLNWERYLYDDESLPYQYQVYDDIQWNQTKLQEFRNLGFNNDFIIYGQKNSTSYGMGFHADKVGLRTYRTNTKDNVVCVEH